MSSIQNKNIKDLSKDREQVKDAELNIPKALSKSFENDINIDKNLKENLEYVLFTQNYKIALEILKKQFFSINSIGKIDKDLLYNSVLKIIENIEYKNKVFYYICYLENAELHTYTHCLNVGLIAHMFGIWLGIEEEELKNLTITGLLHDIGKIKLDINLLNKRETLTEEEFEYIKTHSYLGYNLLENLPLSDDIKYGVLMHHEKINGYGYPIGLMEDRIPKFAKIIAICDMYDAMTSPRLYRQKNCPFSVIREFEQNIYEILDANLLLSFLQNIAYVYIGCDVMLSNNEVAEIVYINPKNITKPIIKINDEIVDLSKNKDLDIVYLI